MIMTIAIIECKQSLKQNEIFNIFNWTFFHNNKKKKNQKKKRMIEKKIKTLRRTALA